MATMKVNIRMRTPLWTGGIDGTMDRIHETGILGSLRWWYEAIVRGLGGWACDPSEHMCELSGQRLRTYENAHREGKDWWTALDEAGICDACKVFGTTGWRRRFQIEVRPLEGEIDVTEGMFPSGRVHSQGQSKYRTGGWLLRGGYHGTVELKFIGDKKVLWCEILPVLLFVEKWGALGPKTSLGYGVFEILSIDRQHKEPGQCWREFLQNKSSAVFDLQECPGLVGQWWWGAQAPNSVHQGILPALTNMFFAKVRFSSQNSNWWEQFREVQWLKQGNIPQNEATWTGQEPRHPPSLYTISNPLPVTRLQHWAACHSTFPIAPILRTRLRYGSQSVSVCNGSGESDWCKFVFGTVQGKSSVCGYCGTPVQKDQNHWRCNTEEIPLNNLEVVHDAKRIQSKIRISWAYQLNNNEEWEVRIWGWLPEGRDQNQRNQLRWDFLRKLQNVLGINGNNPRKWHTPQNGALWSDLGLTPTQVCWFVRDDNESGESYLKVLLEWCGQTSHGDTGNTEK